MIAASQTTDRGERAVPCGVRVLHELRGQGSGRIRLRARMFYEPSLDPEYVEARFLALSGVASARFNSAAACVVIGYDGAETTRAAILEAIAYLPPEAYHPEHQGDGTTGGAALAAKVTAAAGSFLLPRTARAPVAGLLALPVLLKGAETLGARGLKVEVLDAMVVGFSLLRGDYLTANTIVVLLGLSAYLEKLTERRSTDLLKSLLRPQVETVWVKRGEHEIAVSPEEVGIGDLVVCGTGELVPVDGVVAEGEAAVNASSITGESLPVHVKPGDELLSGSVVEEGSLVIEAKGVGAETNLARIGRFLERSLRARSTTEKESDRMADRLVPLTFGLGAGLYLLTRDIRRAASVLTVDYACAIKLASPVAVKSSMYRATREGVLIKGADALEALAKVDTLVFDKTGTLTTGRLSVTDVIPSAAWRQSGQSDEELLALAASAEAHYGHPVARAVVAEAKAQKLDLPPMSRVDFIVAHGVSARVDTRTVLVGSHHFVAEDEAVDCAEMDGTAMALRGGGKSLLYVAVDNVFMGVIALRDTLRPEARQTLADLKDSGIARIVVLTGDHGDTARALAANVPEIDEIHWELTPEGKAEIVKRLKDEGRNVAFAGDGVNDAPALLTADVGVCMPGGADLARESAQAVLLKEDLAALATARRVAERCGETIRNSFYSSVLLNTGALALASTGRTSPLLSALLHNVTTASVLSYAALRSGFTDLGRDLLSGRPGSANPAEPTGPSSRSEADA